MAKVVQRRLRILHGGCKTTYPRKGRLYFEQYLEETFAVTILHFKGSMGRCCLVRDGLRAGNFRIQILLNQDRAKMQIVQVSFLQA